LWTNTLNFRHSEFQTYNNTNNTINLYVASLSVICDLTIWDLTACAHFPSFQDTPLFPCVLHVQANA
jgi:hypothetical protein